jgi:cell division protein FtsZ
MPAIDEFPPQVKRQIEAQQTRIESIADLAGKKKPGLFQRLASVGLGRKEEQPEETGPREPSMSSQQSSYGVRPAQSRPGAPMPSPQQAELNLDDDQLEIPAFLRRQAN